MVKNLIRRLNKRVVPVLDLSAWFLILLGAIPLFFLDGVLFLTLVEWAVFSLALAGLAVIVSRVVGPQVDLTEWLERAREGNLAAGLVVLAIYAFLGMVFLGFILWARS